jgi:hypothetical protein
MLKPVLMNKNHIDKYMLTDIHNHIHYTLLNGFNYI